MLHLQLVQDPGAAGGGPWPSAEPGPGDDLRKVSYRMGFNDQEIVALSGQSPSLCPVCSKSNCLNTGLALEYILLAGVGLSFFASCMLLSNRLVSNKVQEKLTFKKPAACLKTSVCGTVMLQARTRLDVPPQQVWLWKG